MIIVYSFAFLWSLYNVGNGISKGTDMSFIVMGIGVSILIFLMLIQEIFISEVKLF